MDAQEQKAIDNIAKFGCHVMLVAAEDDLPQFAYSVGIQNTCGAPEVVIIGLNDKLAHSIVNNYCRRAKTGETFEDGKFYSEFIQGFDIQVRKVRRSWYREYFGWCLWYYKGKEFEVVQLVYPTTSGKWPWDKDAPEGYIKWQPLLDAEKQS